MIKGICYFDFLCSKTRLCIARYLKDKGIFCANIGNTLGMKKYLTVEQAKQMVELSKGKNISLKLNKGRNRIKKCKGVIAEVHPHVFVVQLFGDIVDHISCSYTDIVCGEVSFTEQC